MRSPATKPPTARPAPDPQAPAPWHVRPVLWIVHGYRAGISPLLGPRCRYLPTCSEYTLDALREHGLVRGLQLSVSRVLRCHPWGGSGHDPVPPGKR